MKFVFKTSSLAILFAICVHNSRSFAQQNEKDNFLVKAGAELKWWQQTVIYQIYPRSFQDSDGDGVGDLKGITSRLDHIAELGVGAIWISPIYKSPMKDFGYDISDFIDVDPQFGTMEDFRELASEMRKRGIKLIMDMIPNHSSDLHEWFVKSVQKIEPYTDFYVWRNANGTDEQGKPKPPNNWVSYFGGSAWEWNDQRQQFYLHQFVVEQPDLNYENIKVRNAMLAVIKFWLDQGVDGFRVDAVQTIFEDPRELDEPANPNRDPNARPDEHRYYSHIYTEHQPKTFEWLADAWQLIHVYSAADGIERAMMVETYIPAELVDAYYGTEDKPVTDFPFNMELINVRPNFTATEVLKHVNYYVPEGRWANYLTGNHDQRRADTRWTKQGLDGANMINLLLRGTAVTYYGEEIGMEDTYISWEDTVDPAGCNTDPDRYEQFTRDPARTPMQWDNSTNSGFSAASKTWLPVNENYKTLNVAEQKKAVESHMAVYKELVKLRNSDVWRYGEYASRALNQDRVLAFTRIAPKEVDGRGILVLVNLSEESVDVDATVFNNVPPVAFVLIRSVGFENQGTTVGSSINNRQIQLGPRNSLVVQFNVV